MKVAVLYSGLPKINQEIFDNHKKYILDLYDCDIYVHTYSDFKNLNADESVRILRPRKYGIESWATVEGNFNQRAEKIQNKYYETNPVNVFSMFYKIEQCFSLIADERYDFVVRNRLDIQFDAPLNLEKNDFINIPKGGDHRGGVFDLFSYGSFESVSKYCSVYSQLDKYISEGFVFHPESLLRHHCDRTGLAISRFPYNVYLRGLSSTAEV